MLSDLFAFFLRYATATPAIYTLSLHDALPIFHLQIEVVIAAATVVCQRRIRDDRRSTHVKEVDVVLIGGISDVGDCAVQDRKSTRLNSSHLVISYAVFCLKKKINKS